MQQQCTGNPRSRWTGVDQHSQRLDQQLPVNRHATEGDVHRDFSSQFPGMSMINGGDVHNVQMAVNLCYHVSWATRIQGLRRAVGPLRIWPQWISHLGQRFHIAQFRSQCWRNNNRAQIHTDQITDVRVNRRVTGWYADCRNRCRVLSPSGQAHPKPLSQCHGRDALQRKREVQSACSQI